MSTSAAEPTSLVLLAVVLALAIALGGTLSGLGWNVARIHNVPTVAVVLWSVVAVPSLLQIPFPAIRVAFERDPMLVRDDQWWRIMTSVLVQDGGIGGMVANLVILGVVAPVAGRVWGNGRTLLLFGTSQLILGLFTAFVFPSPGAGYSGATCALAASIAGLAVMQSPRRRELVMAAGVVLAGIMMVAVDDAHGLAILTGALLGAAMGTVSPPVVASARSHVPR